MERYAPIYTKFWEDEKVVTWTPEVRALALYVMSSPRSNMIGFYRLPLGYVVADTGYGFETVSEGFRKLIAERFLDYDEAAQIVLVRNHFKHNKLANPNQIKGALRVARELPRTDLLPEFVAVVSAWHIQQGFQGPAEVWQTLLEPFRNGFETVPQTVPKPEYRVQSTSSSAPNSNLAGTAIEPMRERVEDYVDAHFPHWRKTGARGWGTIEALAEILGWGAVWGAVTITMGAGTKDLRYLEGILTNWAADREAK